MIIRTSAGQLYSVKECADPALAHCWQGQRVKVEGMKFVPVKKLRTELIRKVGSVVVQN